MKNGFAIREKCGLNIKHYGFYKNSFEAKKGLDEMKKNNNCEYFLVYGQPEDIDTAGSYSKFSEMPQPGGGPI